MEKKPYIKPELTVIKCRSEAGYILSDSSSAVQLFLLTDPLTQKYSDTEIFSIHETWTAENNGGSFWN